MRAGGGKQKGAQFEREVCVLLSRWISKGEKEDLFWRSAMSGGRATVARKSEKTALHMQVGDISAIDPMGMSFIQAFAVECKFYNDLNFKGLFLGMGKLIDFWTEIKKQAEDHNKFPILFARQNRMPTFVCCGELGMSLLQLVPKKHAVIINPPNDLYVMHVDHFFTHTKPYGA